MAMTRNSRTAPVSLERAIRPFLPVQARPDRSRVYFNGGTRAKGDVQDTEGEDVPTLEWGASMGTETLTIESQGFTVSLGNDSGDEVNDEIQRSTHQVRVYSSENPDDFVEVQVTDWVQFRDANKRKRRLNFTNP